MGRRRAGKTSMHAIIFANYPAKETMGIGFTIDVNESKFKFMGKFVLNLWDCGGQERLMKHYFSSQRETIFKNVEVLIYVFDISSDESKEDMNDYKQAIANLAIYSKNAFVFPLIHKMDKIPEHERAAAFEQKKAEILEASASVTVKEVFATSIWDETLYKAWSQIVQLLIPNLDTFKESLKQLSHICDCDEIVVFEKLTFLVIAYHDNRPKKDILRYERISNIIKQFKLSCGKLGTDIEQMTVKNSKFTVIIKGFTDNTYIMMVVSDPKVEKSAIELNIDSATSYFKTHNRGSEMDNLLFQWKKE
eukprot:TRINITY_DN1314_c0_g1_i6.p1 TRINITY_DN1314_c0_g1~~TRINITY_DN1314_c0_g1_i6.p1  ORF type:complete len:306 (-),score=68.12 TRINITY_DN1314_c0_g1_i6:227-1144(-)